MRKMKVWMGEDNFTEIEVDDMDLIQRIKSLRNLNVERVSENEWFLGKVDGAKVGVDFFSREVWTVVDNNKVSVSVTDQEYEFLNKIVDESKNEK